MFEKSVPASRCAGFTYLEALVALTVLLAVMAVAFAAFAEFGSAMNTETTVLATQQAARTALDEVSRSLRQMGYGLSRVNESNPASWQRGLIHGDSHFLAFNADIDPAIGALPGSQTLALPGGASYKGEGLAAIPYGAETYVYTLDANGDGAITNTDRSAVPTGSFNPAADTPAALDFTLFRRVLGYNGTDYGGKLEPLAANLFTNATADAVYPDGTTPDPLFVYWLTEDINGDGILQDAECVDDVIATCPPGAARRPRLYMWGDTNFDGKLSESEKAALNTLPVGSVSWSKNRLVQGGAYTSTALAGAIDPSDPMNNEITVNDATKIGPGYHVRIGTGLAAETLTIDQASTTTTPDRATLTDRPIRAHSAGEAVTVLPSTLLAAVRSVGVTFSAMAGRADVQGGVRVAGREGHVGTRGLDERVTPYRRQIEVVNAPTSALVNDVGLSAEDICPLEIVNQCDGAMSTSSRRYKGFGGSSGLSFVVTDEMGNPIAGKTVEFSNSNSSIGTLAAATGTTDSSGIATVTYSLNGPLGSDTVTAEVECLNESGGTVTASATNAIGVFQVQASAAQDCLSTASSKTPLPTTSFTVQVTGGSGPGVGHELALGLAFDGGYLPPSPNFSQLVGALSIAGGGSGNTGTSGSMSPLTVTTDSSGQVVGSVQLLSDAAATGARLDLTTAAGATACSGGGSASTKVDFFSLLLDSTTPAAGCKETAGCTIAANSNPPRARATLSIGGDAVSGATLQFTRQDVSPPVGAASKIAPSTGVVSTDVAGQGSLIVLNNGASSITPTTPLETLIDVSAAGPAGLCSAGTIASSSPRVRFDFTGPVGVCQAAVSQAWVSKIDSKKICLHIKNQNAAGGCPMKMTGIKLSTKDATGLALDAAVKYAKIEGGAVTASASCASGGAVTLFKDDCRSPKTKLGNGEQWNYNTAGSCSLPPSNVNPTQYFTVNRVEFENNYPVGRQLDVAVSFECEGSCDTDTVDTQVFTITTP